MKIGFLGFGSMNSAVCDGLLLKGAVAPCDAYATGRNQEKLAANCAQRGINACASNDELIANSDIIVIGLHKADMEEGLGVGAHATADAETKFQGKILVSIAAGCGYDFYEDILPAGSMHISTIPNTPISVGEGIIVAEDIHTFSDEALAAFEAVFGRAALIEYVPPKHLALGGCIAGSTPAFAAMMIEALGDAGVKYGLSRKAAYRLVAQMMAGTGKLAVTTGQHPAEMKDAVCSPGGSTILGVHALERMGFRAALEAAVDDTLSVYDL